MPFILPAFFLGHLSIFFITIFGFTKSISNYFHIYALVFLSYMTILDKSLFLFENDILFQVVRFFYFLILLFIVIYKYKLKILSRSIIIPFILFLIFHSIVFSELKFVSIMKITQFAAYVILLSWLVDTEHKYILLLKVLYKIGLSFVIISLFLYFIYPINILIAEKGSSFKGFFYHQQTASVIAGLLFAIGLIIPRKFKIVELFLLSFSVFLTNGRIGLLIILFSIIYYFAFNFKNIFNQLGRSKYDTVIVPFFIIFIGLLSAISFSYLPNLFLKHGAEDVYSSFETSRASQLVTLWDNIQTKIWGIGFGVPSSLELNDFAVKVNGIPISVPTEKGILPLMLIEEVSIVGLILFIYFIIKAFKISLKINKKYSLFIIAIIVANTAEAAFFSINGMGSFFILLISFLLYNNSNSISHSNE